MSKSRNNPDIPDDLGDEYPLECYKNRELSWLEFNARVLEEANDTDSNPLCERLNFLSIFQSNLDEYFMVRVGLLFDQRKLNLVDAKTGMTSGEQLDAVISETGRLLKRKDKTWKTLAKELKANGFELVRYADLTDKERRSMERYFTTDVLPFLSPQIVSSRQPFPFLANKDIYAISLLKKKGEGTFLGIVPCSASVVRRLIPVSAESGRYLLAEELIVNCSGRIFEHYQVSGSTLIRIVRNADITVDDMKGEEQKDYRRSMEKMIQRRKKLSPIKLEYSGMVDAEVVNTLCRYLKLPRRHAFPSAAPLDLRFFSQVRSLLADRKELFYIPRSALRSPMISEQERVTDTVRRHDVLLSFPYESMRPFLRLLDEAANDEDVVSIKITLYRVATNSQIVDALIRAAENGKEVLVMMELRARFDEENNVIHSKDLENAGCRLIYGLDDYKVHSKLCLITRRHGDGIEYITQVGTGNYNENTARIYTDYSLMTADRDIGEEAAAVFTSLSLGEPVHHTDCLLVAPECLQNRILAMIDREIEKAAEGQDAYVGMKLNSITDKAVIDKLIEASRAGVKIQLLVRGICCIVPGVPGYTENVEVYSIVGRYLEHSRVYIFGRNGCEHMYIASADMMTRNTLHRVEVAIPILDETLRGALLEDFTRLLSDNVKLRIMQEDGTYRHMERPAGAEPFCAHEYFAAGGFRSQSAPEEEHEAPPQKSRRSSAPAGPAAPVSVPAQSAGENAPAGNGADAQLTGWQKVMESIKRIFKLEDTEG